MTSKQAYWYLVSKVCSTPTGQSRIEGYLGVDSLHWEEVYMVPIESTMEGKLRSFQFKILHDILNVKNNLFRWKISENSYCRFCNLQNETLIHFFFDCEIVKNFLDSFCDWWHMYTGHIFLIENASLVLLGLGDM